MNESTSRDPSAVKVLLTLAVSDPDYAAFVKQHSGLSDVVVPEGVENELILQVMALLEQLPERATQLQRLKSGNGPRTYDAGLGSIPILVAAAFLLRTHLRIKRSADGKWEFLAEHKPGDSALVKQVLNKVMQLLS